VTSRRTAAERERIEGNSSTGSPSAIETSCLSCSPLSPVRFEHHDLPVIARICRLVFTVGRYGEAWSIAPSSRCSGHSRSSVPASRPRRRPV
jgi:hypothetical protein